MAIIVGFIVLMNLLVFVSMTIASAMAGDWRPAIALGHVLLTLTAVVAVLSFIGWVIERLGRRA